MIYLFKGNECQNLKQANPIVRGINHEFWKLFLVYDFMFLNESVIVPILQNM